MGPEVWTRGTGVSGLPDAEGHPHAHVRRRPIQHACPALAEGGRWEDMAVIDSIGRLTR